MTKAALFTKGRPASLRTASEYTIPGLDAEDVRQEALEAFWVALAALAAGLFWVLTGLFR